MEEKKKPVEVEDLPGKTEVSEDDLAKVVGGRAITQPSPREPVLPPPPKPRE